LRFGTLCWRVGRTHVLFPPDSPAVQAGALFALVGLVIWFYEKKGEHLRCEIRQQVEGDRFTLVVTLPDGSERSEIFDDSRTLNTRSLELEKMLRDKGWNGPFARGI